MRMSKLPLRELLEGQPWFRPLHSMYVGWRARHGGHPEWRRILGVEEERWCDRLAKARRGGRKVLIATSLGGHLPSATVESMLGVALGMQGVEPEFLLCDAALPACMLCEVRWYRDLERFRREGPAKDHCLHCCDPAAQALAALDVRVRRYGEYLDDETRSRVRKLVKEIPLSEIRSLRVEEVSVGEHALAGTLRFFARGRLDYRPAEEEVLRQYLVASLLTLYAVRTLLRSHSYECVVLHHGIYVPQGIVAETASSLGVRVVTWHPAYRSGCFVFSHGSSYHHTLMTEPTKVWEDLPWSDALETRIMDYLRARWTGSRDWISFQNASTFDRSDIEAEVGVDFSHPCIGLLTNVFWDAQLHYPANAFHDMLDWLLGTVRYFAQRPALQLLIRIHPAELSGTVPSRQHMAEELRAAFPIWPTNVFVIPPESGVSTYAAMEGCDSVIIYGTKTGVELTSMGIPVIVAGEAWIRGKGLTLDACDEQDYYRLLDRLPLGQRMEPEQVKRARKYAYHFFFRRMIPLDFMQPQRGWPPYRVAVTGLDDLAPGRSQGLDLICEGIFEERSFVYPDENSGDE